MNWMHSTRSTDNHTPTFLWEKPKFFGESWNYWNSNFWMDTATLNILKHATKPTLAPAWGIAPAGDAKLDKFLVQQLGSTTWKAENQW